MPFCPRCGKEVGSESTYCYYCGQSLPKIQSVHTEPKTLQAPTIKKEVTPSPKTHKTRNFAIIVIVLIAVVAVAVTAYYGGTTFLNQLNLFPNTQQGQGVMAIQSYYIFPGSPDHVLVSVMNNGTTDLIIATAYIDGAQASLSNSLSLGAGQTTIFMVTASSGQNLANGVSHQLKIVASDRTSDTIGIVYTPPQQGAMAIDYRKIDNDTQIILYLINVGSTTLTVGKAYVDGQIQSMNPVVLAPNQGQIVAITGSGTDWTAGGTNSWHTIRIVANDGTVVSITLPYVPSGQSAMSVDYDTINSNTQITVILRNIGYNTLDVNTAYVDNVLQSMNPVVIAPNQVQVATITGDGTNWTGSFRHYVQIEALGCTPVGFNVGYSPPPQGSMGIQSYQIFQNNPDYVSVTMKNIGTTNLTIATAYIDGAQASVSGSLSFSTGQTTTFTVTPSSGQNLTDHNSHQLKIVATDGTNYAIAIVYSG